ncbi:hypothetical protein D3C87_1854440 [compost metagenome]
MAVEHLIKIESHARSREGGMVLRGMINPCPFGNTLKPCGSWLASDSGGSVTIIVGGADVIAGKPAPTGFAVVSRSADKRPTVGFHTDRVVIVYSEKVGRRLPQP